VTARRLIQFMLVLIAIALVAAGVGIAARHADDTATQSLSRMVAGAHVILAVALIGALWVFRDRSRQMIESALAVVLLAVGIHVMGGLASLREDPEAEQAIQRGPLVKATSLRKQDAPVTVGGFGTVSPAVSARLTPQVAGKVTWISPQLRPGGRFRANDPLIRIDPTDYELAVEEAAAELKRAKQAIASAEAGIAEARSVLADAELEARRLEDLRKTNSATQRELDRARFAQQQAQARLDAAVAARDQAESSRSLARTRLRNAEVQLGRTELSVPFDGCVINEQVDLGQFAQVGQQLGEVYGEDVMEVAIPLDTRQLAWITVPDPEQRDDKVTGSTATLTTEYAGQPRTWTGRVDRLEGEIDRTTRMAHVVIRIDRTRSEDGEVRLLPGMFVEASIEGQTLRNVFAIPRHALRIGGKVWLAENGRLQFHDVEIVRRSGDQLFVRGLTAGQVLVTSSLDVYTDGMLIRTDVGPSALANQPTDDAPTAPEASP